MFQKRRMNSWQLLLGAALVTIFAPLTAFAAGGDGSGGGNASTSQPRDVSAQLSVLKPRMQLILNRVHAWDQDRKSDSIQFQWIEDFFGKNDLASVIKNMTVHVQDEPCDFEGEHKAGRADQNTQTICMSVEQLSLLSEKARSLEIDVLGFHEVAHLVGLGEFEAKLIQDWLLGQPWMTDISNPNIRAYLNVYDSTIRKMSDVIVTAGFANQSGISICQKVTMFEDQLANLNEILDTAPGTIWRRQNVPRHLMPDEMAKEMVPIFHWQNKQCDSDKVTRKQRIQTLTQAMTARNYLVRQMAKLAVYGSGDDKNFGLPSIVGMHEYIVAAEVLALLKKDKKITNAEFDVKRATCQLTDLRTNAGIPLLKSSDPKYTFGGTVRDQDGNSRDLQIQLRYGVAMVQTEFNKYDLIALPGTQPLQLANYFGAVFGGYIQLAAIDGFRSFQSDFYVIKRDQESDDVHPANTYRLSCDIH